MGVGGGVGGGFPTKTMYPTIIIESCAVGVDVSLSLVPHSYLSSLFSIKWHLCTYNTTNTHHCKTRVNKKAILLLALKWVLVF